MRFGHSEQCSPPHLFLQLAAAEVATDGQRLRHDVAAVRTAAEAAAAAAADAKAAAARTAQDCTDAAGRAAQVTARCRSHRAHSQASLRVEFTAARCASRCGHCEAATEPSVYCAALQAALLQLRESHEKAKADEKLRLTVR